MALVLSGPLVPGILGRTVSVVGVLRQTWRRGTPSLGQEATERFNWA